MYIYTHIYILHILTCITGVKDIKNSQHKLNITYILFYLSKNSYHKLSKTINIIFGYIGDEFSSMTEKGNKGFKGYVRKS